MNYFELYEIPETLYVDPVLAKKKFLELSRKFHPDFHGGADEMKQMEVLEMATLNTNAFNAFKNREKTIEYVLKERDLLVEGYQLAPDFLMEMMEINEQLMELEFDFDPEVLEKIKEAVSIVKAQMESELSPVLSAFESADEPTKNSLLEQAQEYYYKHKYLKRIEDTIFKLGS